MKIRTDYVTNSSSSSFILGFKDEGSILDTLYHDNTGNYLRQICSDCERAQKMTLDEMLEIASEEMKWNVRWDIEEYGRYELGMDYDEVYKWRHTQEFDELVEKEMEKRLNDIKEMAKGMNTFVLVNYLDDINGELEHEIVPELRCCLATFNHH